MAVKTIIVKGKGVRKEGIAVAAITPGNLIERAATGVQKHSTAAANAAPAFAVENEVVGNDIDTDYATADTVLFVVAGSGVEIHAIVSGSVALGDFLESDGLGGLRTAATAAATTEAERNGVIAVALAANVTTRCLVEIL